MTAVGVRGKIVNGTEQSVGRVLNGTGQWSVVETGKVTSHWYCDGAHMQDRKAGRALGIHCKFTVTHLEDMVYLHTHSTTMSKETLQTYEVQQTIALG